MVSITALIALLVCLSLPWLYLLPQRELAPAETFADPAALATAVAQAKSAGVQVSGLMGYEPHIPKMPDPDSAYADAQQAYGKAIEVLQQSGLDPAAIAAHFAPLDPDLTFLEG